MRVPLGMGAFNRTFGRGPEIRLLNRFFEQSPTNQTDGVSLLSRPGSTFENAFGNGPIRAQFTLPGIHDGDLFIVSATEFYRYDADENVQLVTGVVTSPGNPRMCAAKGADYQRVFIADGALLQYYGGQAYQATLTLTPGTIADDTVVIDGVYYKFASGSLDTGSPSGTSSNPWKVNIGGSNADALANLRKAINASGVAGTDYSTALTANPRVESNSNTSVTVGVRGRVAGPLTPQAAVSVIVDGSADGLAWNVSVLTAGAHVLYGIATPDDVGIVSVAELDSFILCAVANSDRVYFIRPGEIEIDPLDFFTAESSPDGIIELIKVGDQVWLIGNKSIEPWYSNGTDDPNEIPFSRVQGRPFSIGAREGTVVSGANGVFLVGSDGIVYRIEGGPQPISNPGIAELVRLAYEDEKANS